MARALMGIGALVFSAAVLAGCSKRCEDARGSAAKEWVQLLAGYDAEVSARQSAARDLEKRTAEAEREVSRKELDADEARVQADREALTEKTRRGAPSEAATRRV